MSNYSSPYIYPHVTNPNIVNYEEKNIKFTDIFSIIIYLRLSNIIIIIFNVISTDGVRYKRTLLLSRTIIKNNQIARTPNLHVLWGVFNEHDIALEWPYSKKKNRTPFFSTNTKNVRIVITKTIYDTYTCMFIITTTFNVHKL